MAVPGPESGRRDLGVGLVYWPALAPLFEAGPETVAVLELEPQAYWEKVCPAGRWQYRLDEALLDQVASHHQAKLVHGVGQPVGGSTQDPLDQVPLLRRVVGQLDPAWVSEHLSFNRVRTGRGVTETGFLLPPLQSRAGVRVAATNIARYRRALGRPVAFETGANYLRARDDEMDDGSFFSAVAEEAGSGILLDLHNLWCNEVNGRDPVVKVLARLPLDRVWELHLAGGLPFSGYRLDAHSGLVPERLMEITADLMPRLPNLGALIFEILPEHVPAVGLDGIHRQLDDLRGLWKLRPPRTARNRPASKAASNRPLADDLAEVRAWETALVDAVHGSPGGTSGRGTENPFCQPLRGDPGLQVFRQLIADFRLGALARTLRYTMTALLAGLGKRKTHELLNTYLASRQPETYAAVEAHHFACFLLERPRLLDRVRYSSELLQFEHALVKATVFGVSSQVQWTADPTSILEALDLGRLPARLPPCGGVMQISAPDEPRRTTGPTWAGSRRGDQQPVGDVPDSQSRAEKKVRIMGADTTNPTRPGTTHKRSDGGSSKS